MKESRKFQILKLIVEEYIKTSQPVGSKTLLEKYKLDCSSATIRNAMAELENEDYLEKTHVSSGRVPSPKGYQYYLDHLDSKSWSNQVDLDFQKEFQTIIDNKTSSMEDSLKQSCEMLSEITNMAIVVLGPKADQESLVSIQLIPLGTNQALGILITDSGYVEKKTFVLPNNSTAYFSTMESAVKVLNEKLTGTKITQLEEKAKLLAPVIVQTFGQSGQFVMRAFLEALIGFAKKRFEVYGQKNLLSLPEYSQDSEAFLNAIEALTNPLGLEHDLSSNDDLGDVKVGFTNDNAGDLAIVSKSLSSKDSIAVVGPKRMDYKQVLGILDYVIYMLNKKFSSSTSTSALIPVEPVKEAIDTTKHTPTPAKKKSTKKGGKNK